MGLKERSIEGVKEDGASGETAEAAKLAGYWPIRAGRGDFWYQFTREQANAMLRRRARRWCKEGECSSDASGLERNPNGILRQSSR